MNYEDMLLHREWLISLQDMKADESKRMGDATVDEIFGSEGNFRALTVD